MAAGLAHSPDGNAAIRFVAAARWLLRTLVRPPRRSRAADVARARSWQWLGFCAACAVLIVASMFLVDVSVIKLMPPRGAPGLWPVRLYTDLGQSEFVLWVLGLTVIALGLRAALSPDSAANRVLASLAIRFSYIFFAVLIPNVFGRLIKEAIGRGRPFVGGEANAFNFSPFSGDVKFESFPSSHAVTAFALAFAVSALWPRLRVVMYVYAVLMLLSRIALLAHHPSDVIGGAAVGLLGAMLVREWYAARRLGFAITPNGSVECLPGPSREELKRVARLRPGS